MYLMGPRSLIWKTMHQSYSMESCLAVMWAIYTGARRKWSITNFHRWGKHANSWTALVSIFEFRSVQEKDPYKFTVFRKNLLWFWSTVCLENLGEKWEVPNATLPQFWSLMSLVKGHSDEYSIQKSYEWLWFSCKYYCKYILLASMHSEGYRDMLLESGFMEAYGVCMEFSWFASIHVEHQTMSMCTPTVQQPLTSVSITSKVFQLFPLFLSFSNPISLAHQNWSLFF